MGKQQGGPRSLAIKNMHSGHMDTTPPMAAAASVDTGRQCGTVHGFSNLAPISPMREL